MTVKMWVIGGVYQYKNETFRLDGFHRISSELWLHMKSLDVEGKETGFQVNDEITGSTHVPCPLCGELQQVHTDGLQIDLSEHLMRHHPSELAKEQDSAVVVSDSRPLAGDGHRLLDENETLMPGDEFFGICDEWKRSENADRGAPQQRGLDYRRKLRYPGLISGCGFRFVDADEVPEPTDELWSFVAEEWKSAEHAQCSEFVGLPVVRRRRVNAQ